MPPSADAIPLADLVIRDCYRIGSRNLDVGVWNGEAFLGLREKFGSVFVFGEVHWDLSDSFGTAWAIERVDRLPEDILLAERLPGTWCATCDGPVEFDPEDSEWYHLSLPMCGEARPTSKANRALHEWLEAHTPDQPSTPARLIRSGEVPPPDRQGPI